MRIVKAGALYFAVVFGTGLVLGAIRTWWAAPSLGTRMAELTEAPIMFIVVVVVACWVVRRVAVPGTLSSMLGMGGIALGLMLLAEFGLVLWLRGLSIGEYLATRDPVSRAVYYLSLIVFAILPLLLARK